MHLPAALAVLVAGTVVVLVLGWAGRWWSTATKFQHAALAITSTGLAVMLAAWQLIGWGLT